MSSRASRYALLSTILILVFCGSISKARGREPGPVEDALVVVATQAFGKMGVANGFIIGDGTLVVTASHAVFEASEKGGHRMEGRAHIFSPYLGDTCVAEMVAVDLQLDLAIVQVPWKGHPGLSLAGQQNVLSATHLDVIGMPYVNAALTPATDQAAEPAEQWASVKAEHLPVARVLVQDGLPQLIRLANLGQVGEGWSGSPMVLPGTARVAGCFTTKAELTLRSRRFGDLSAELTTGIGPAAAQVKRLLTKLGTETPLQSPTRVLPRPKDGMKCFLLSLRITRSVLDNRYQAAFDGAQEFISLRPRSAFGYRVSARAADKLGKYPLAEALYQKAMTLDLAGTRPLYAQYLVARGRYKEALEHLEMVWQSCKQKPWAALLMFNVLSGQGKFEKAAQYLKKGLEVNRQNAILWANLGLCQAKLEDYDAAISSYVRAVDLLPEMGPIRMALAHLLEKHGRVDEAEKHFRMLLEVEAENPVVHFLLAKFLFNHRPTATKEAIREAESALRLPSRESLPEREIEELLRRLRSKAADNRITD